MISQPNSSPTQTKRFVYIGHSSQIKREVACDWHIDITCISLPMKLERSFAEEAFAPLILVRILWLWRRRGKPCIRWPGDNDGLIGKERFDELGSLKGASARHARIHVLEKVVCMASYHALKKLR